MAEGSAVAESEQKEEEVALEQDPVWRRLSSEQIVEYGRVVREDGAVPAGFLLSEALSLPDYSVDVRSAAKVDFASFALDFAASQKFSTMQTAAILNVAMDLLEGCSGGAAFTETQEALKEGLIVLVNPRPKINSPQLSPEQAARVGMFLSRTFMRHFRLYTHTFSHEQDVTQYTQDLLVETSNMPTSLAAAVTDTEWFGGIEDRRAQAEADATAAEEAATADAKEAERQRVIQEKVDAEARRKWEMEMKPTNLDEAIKQLVAQKLEQEKELLMAEFKAKEEEMLNQINALQVDDSVEGSREQSAKGSASKKK